MAPGNGFEPADLVVSNAGNNQRIDFRQLTAQQFKGGGGTVGMEINSEVRSNLDAWSQ